MIIISQEVCTHVIFTPSMYIRTKVLHFHACKSTTEFSGEWLYAYYHLNIYDTVSHGEISFNTGRY